MISFRFCVFDFQLRVGDAAEKKAKRKEESRMNLANDWGGSSVIAGGVRLPLF